MAGDRRSVVRHCRHVTQFKFRSPPLRHSSRVLSGRLGAKSVHLYGRGLLGTGEGSDAGRGDLHLDFVVAVLMDDDVMLNRATMSKWGFRLGEVTLGFRRLRK